MIESTHAIFTFCLSTFSNPCIAIHENGDVYISVSGVMTHVLDGDAIMAGFVRFTDTVPDVRLATFPADLDFIPVVGRNRTGDVVFRMNSDGTVICKGRAIGKNLRLVRAILGVCTNSSLPIKCGNGVGA
jgi:hypothetical protein